ncbi:carbohydrate ABC transporter permease [Longispora sp. NPDC051575]|uniref:carbohydrate ABC transporter permease n=1 Tax=Longispora sp. NPDC051575 TaxID=3154943 RepID=UPI00343992B8
MSTAGNGVPPDRVGTDAGTGAAKTGTAKASAGAPAKRPKRNRAGGVAKRVGEVVLVLIGLFWLTPTLGLAISSFRPAGASNASGWWTVFSAPGQLTLDNYEKLFGNERIVSSLWNTVLITVPSTILVVVLGSMAAYAFAWIEFPGRDWLFLVVVALIVVPVQVALIPDAEIFGKLGLFGTIPGVVLFHVAFGLPFAIFLLRNFFAGIPKELLEAARIDGGGEAVIFRKVIMPLGWPAIASLAIFQFLWVWNDLLVALVFANPDSAPITYAIREQTRSFSSNIDVIAPGAFLSMVIPLGVFFAFQRYFVQGVMAGSVK